MTRQEKVEWMAIWAAKNSVALKLQGECGFGRECVGIVSGGSYPDYHWYDDAWNRLDKNGEVWVPKDAYHKHECVAVLGRGEDSESQLYDWLKWFEANNFEIQAGVKEDAYRMDNVQMMMGSHLFQRMVRKS